MVIRARAQRGQATVELVALVPALVLLGLAAWWIVAGAATWLHAGAATRVAARAASVGEDHTATVRRVLPAGRVSRDRASLSVTVTSPRLAGVVPGLPITVTRRLDSR